MVQSLDKQKQGACAVQNRFVQLNAKNGSTFSALNIKPDEVSIIIDGVTNFRINKDDIIYGASKLVNESMIATKSQIGITRFASTMTDDSHPPTAADVKKYVDDNAGINLNLDRIYTGSGTIKFISRSFNANNFNTILNEQNREDGYCGFSVNGIKATIGFGFDEKGANPSTSIIVSNRAVRVNAGLFTYNGNSVITEANLADEQNLGVVKLTNTVSLGEQSNTAVTPNGVAEYVDAKIVETGKGFSIIKARQLTPDLKVISGNLIQSGKFVYGVLTLFCPTQKEIALIAQLPVIPKEIQTVKVVRMSNDLVQYEAYIMDDGQIMFASTTTPDVQVGTYTITIAMETK